MPAINLKKVLYDELIRMGEKPTRFVNELVQKNIDKLKGKDIK